MTGNEELTVGDKLICMSNDGLCTFGTEITITDLDGDFISFSSNGRLWEKKSKFRWECYQHVPVKEEKENG